MPVTVMLVLLLAALLHASWNFLVKRTEGKYLAMSAVVLGHTPFALLALSSNPIPACRSRGVYRRRSGAACRVSVFFYWHHIVMAT